MRPMPIQPTRCALPAIAVSSKDPMVGVGWGGPDAAGLNFAGAQLSPRRVGLSTRPCCLPEGSRPRLEGVAREAGIFAQAPGNGLLLVELGAASCDFLRRQARNVGKVKFPIGIVAPSQQRLDACSRQDGRGQ